MDWKELGKKVIGLGAPLLGTALGGPAGGAVGSILASAFGGDPEKPEELLQKITMDSDAIVKLKELELANKVKLQEFILEGERLHLADVASARQREVETVKATGKRDINLYVLAWTIICGFFTLVGLMMFTTIPDVSTQAVGILFGGLVAGFTGVVQYFFGSSKSSQDKTRLMAAK